uniref:Uncharacterized protein n=1 Tax=Anguilla anguilla TaxID=7936 RepID=A0A0E9WR73_ANGAN
MYNKLRKKIFWAYKLQTKIYLIKYVFCILQIYIFLHSLDMNSEDFTTQSLSKAYLTNDLPRAKNGSFPLVFFD